MTDTFARLVGGSIDRVVRWVVVPVTGLIPRLVSSGILLVVFAALWLTFVVALAVDAGTLASIERSIGQLPLPLVALAWLLFMPPMAALWVFGTDWPLVVRLVLIAGIAAWNLLVFVPRREGSADAASTLSTPAA